jgi:hypothetical protein
LENWWLVRKNIGFVMVVGVGYLALFLVEWLGSMQMGTLFVMVLEGK